MTDLGFLGLTIILSNFLCSYNGFKNENFLNKYKFEIDKILINKEYIRLISSGFLHINWMHLIFNMLGIYAFSSLLENQLGELNFLLIYFMSLLGGNLFALFIHRNHADYNAVGASGAVCGIIFASIALYPGLGIGFWGIPFSIPSWLYGILYILYTLYGIKSAKDNIGHEAHLGGAVIGMLVAILLRPNSIQENYIPILVILIPAITFIIIIIKKPQVLLIDNLFFKTHQKYSNIDLDYNEQKLNKQKELDYLLDKISKNGLASLSKKEKERLAFLSN